MGENSIHPGAVDRPVLAKRPLARFSAAEISDWAREVPVRCEAIRRAIEAGIVVRHSAPEA